MSFAIRRNPCRVLRVVDGDTVDLMVDVGFRICTEQRFRLNNYNAPENRGPERELGLLATRDLGRRLYSAEEIVVESSKAGSFGRWLADLYLDGVSIVPELVSEGYGVPWDGRGPRPGFDPSAPYPLGLT